MQPDLSFSGGTLADENTSKGAEGIAAHRFSPPRSLITLKDVGVVPLLGPLVFYPEELIDFCQNMLAIGRPCSTRRYRNMTPREFAVYQRKGADNLRKEGDPDAARSLYRVALRILLHESQDDNAELIMALNALGITSPDFCKKAAPFRPDRNKGRQRSGTNASFKLPL